MIDPDSINFQKCFLTRFKINEIFLSILKKDYPLISSARRTITIHGFSTDIEEREGIRSTNLSFNGEKSGQA